MAKFTAVISCGDDFNNLIEALDKPLHPQAERVLLYSGDIPKRFEFPVKAIERLDALRAGEGGRLFINPNNEETCNEIVTYINQCNADIIFFLESGQVLPDLCFEYIENFFDTHCDRCGVVFLPIVDDGETPLPEEFQNLPPGGLFAFDDNIGTFPSREAGAAVRLDDIRTVGLNPSFVSKTFLDMLTRVAKKKGTFGCIRETAIIQGAKPPEVLTPMNVNSLVNVVIPVSKNVNEKHLDETIESIVNQSAGFDNNTRLVFVGSATDESFEDIFNRYHEKYPANTVCTLIKGMDYASALEAGLFASDGEFVLFADPGYIYEQNFLQTGLELLNAHKSEINFVAFPMYSENTGTPHPLNYRFQNPGIVCLKENPSFFQLSTAGTLILIKAINSISIQSSVAGGETIEMMYELAIEKMKYGVSNKSCVYFKMNEDTNIEVDSKWLYGLAVLVERMVKTSLERFTYLPMYTQTLVISLLQHKHVLNSEIPDDLLNTEALSILKNLINYFDDELIINAKGFSDFYKCYLLQLKHGPPTLLFDINGNGTFCFNNTFKKQINKSIQLVSINCENGCANISGWWRAVNYDRLNVIAVYNGKTFKSNLTDDIYNAICIFGNLVNNSYLFNFNIPFEKEGNISFYVEADGWGRYPLTLSFTSRCRLSKEPGSFVISDKTIIKHADGNSLFISDKFSHATLIAEHKPLEVMLFSNYLSILSQWKNRRIWLFLSQSDETENALMPLFHFCASENDGTEKYYVTHNVESGDSLPDNVVKYRSDKHKLLSLFAEKVISVDLREFANIPYGKKENRQLYTGLIRSKFILMHTEETDTKYLFPGTFALICQLDNNHMEIYKKVIKC
ncbi:MAG: glycosyltransferase family 2 protein [Defluviitaleaceae bacterium]|nr:glycosyltransferase family 2 protein [Defluviitaleaceae bacterium]